MSAAPDLIMAIMDSVGLSMAIIDSVGLIMAIMDSVGLNMAMLRHTITAAIVKYGKGGCCCNTKKNI